MVRVFRNLFGIILLGVLVQGCAGGRRETTGIGYLLFFRPGICLLTSLGDALARDDMRRLETLYANRASANGDFRRLAAWWTLNSGSLEYSLVWGGGSENASMPASAYTNPDSTNAGGVLSPECYCSHTEMLVGLGRIAINEGTVAKIAVKGSAGILQGELVFANSRWRIRRWDRIDP